MKTWKVLDRNRQPFHGGAGRWPKSGEWLEVEGTLVVCENGLHLCRKKELVEWLGPEIWEVEYSGETIQADDKIVVRKARLLKKLATWNAKTARLFAADCAEHVLSIFEKKYPEDQRPRLAIQAARQFARGKITKEKMIAAGNAAKDAAGSAAWAAAWAAARDAARDAAGDAAGDAAWAAAWAAARDAAWAAGSAERKWQTKRLFEYLQGDYDV